METSRDDFVIAIRSAFLKKGTQQRFSLIGLIFFAILIIVLSGYNFKVVNYTKIIINEVVYRSSFIVSIPENYLKKTYTVFNEHFNFYDDYKKIKLDLKNQKSKNLVDQYIILENKRLKNIIDDYIVESEEIIAKILVDKQSPFLKSIVANKGSKNKIKKGMIVLDGEYLIGKVVEVNYLSSRILLLTDLNSKIPVLIEPGGIQAILSGTGGVEGIIEYQKKNYIIEDNSIVYTSGHGSLFKAGIPIGKIKNGNQTNIKKVSFFSDFLQLRFIKIILYKKENLNE